MFARPLQDVFGFVAYFEDQFKYSLTLRLCEYQPMCLSEPALMIFGYNSTCRPQSYRTNQ